MSLRDRGTTIAGIFIMGVVAMFLIPYFSYYLAQLVSYILTSACTACESMSTCSCTSRTLTTLLGNIEVRIPSFSDQFLSLVAQYTSQLLLLVLTAMTRIEVVAAAFAVDLISYTLETTSED